MSVEAGAPPRHTRGPSNDLTRFRHTLPSVLDAVHLRCPDITHCQHAGVWQLREDKVTVLVGPGHTDVTVYLTTSAHRSM